jgi:hypothetical protein
VISLDSGLMSEFSLPSRGEGGKSYVSGWVDEWMKPDTDVGTGKESATIPKWMSR